MDTKQLTQVLVHLQKCVGLPKKNCKLLWEEIEGLNKDIEKLGTDETLGLNYVSNIIQCNEFNIVTGYINLKETYQEPQLCLNISKQEFEKQEKEYASKTETLTKHLEEKLENLKLSNTNKNLVIEKQIQTEKAHFEEQEKKLQIELETLEEVTSFRQEIMETDLTKELVNLSTMINQIKNANNAMKQEIESIQTQKTKKPTANVVTFNLQGSIGPITPEMMSSEFLPYSINSNPNQNVNLSPQIYNTININLNRSNNPRNQEVSVYNPKTKSFNITSKKPTIAVIPQNKKSVTSSKYMPLPIYTPENQTSNEIQNKKREYKGKSKDVIQNKNVSEENIRNPQNINTNEPSKRKKRKLYNPDLDLEYLKQLGEED